MAVLIAVRSATAPAPASAAVAVIAAKSIFPIAVVCNKDIKFKISNKHVSDYNNGVLHIV